MKYHYKRCSSAGSFAIHEQEQHYCKTQFHWITCYYLKLFFLHNSFSCRFAILLGICCSWDNCWDCISHSSCFSFLWGKKRVTTAKIDHQRNFNVNFIVGLGTYFMWMPLYFFRVFHIIAFIYICSFSDSVTVMVAIMSLTITFRIRHY